LPSGTESQNRFVFRVSIGLASAVDSADYAPTNQSYDVYNDLTAKIDAQLAIFAHIKTEDIAEFNKTLAEKNLPVIVTKSK
jgi:hypothetical protein